MAIQKKLLHFNDKSNFELLLERGNILDTSIVFILSTGLIWTHGLYYNSLTDEIINLLDNIPTKVSLLENDSYYISNKPVGANVGDAVLVNKTTLKKVAVNLNKLSNYSVDEWEPIGVVVIPSSHDVYGTGECGVMALMSASLTTPDTGQTSNVGIAWGAYGTSYPELNNFDQANIITSNDDNYVLGYAVYPYLPSDNFSGNLSLDGIAKYILSPNSPSPYNADGSRNPLYFATGVIEPTLPIYGEGVPATTPGLNVSWETQTGAWNEEQNGDSYDGKQFKSISPGSSGSTIIRCKFSGIAGKIVFRCKYDGENNFDYLTIGNLDTSCTRTSYGKSLKGTTGVWSEVEFNIPDTNEHYVEFCYSKDSSGDTAPDCATVFILSEKRDILQFGFSGAGTTANVLSDFAGKSNTEFLCSKATKQENWKTDVTIINNTSSLTTDAAGYHPAACACWRFHTVGTSQGDWYLPACGELGYCCVRYKLINETITALQAWSGKTYCSLTSYHFLSSSERGIYQIRGVNFARGSVSDSYRNGSNYVRPFLRLSFNLELNDILSNYYTKEESDSAFANKDEIINKSVLEVTSNILSEDFTTCTIENTGINVCEDRLLYISYHVDALNAEGNIITEKSYIPLYLEEILDDSATPCKLLFSNIAGDYKYTAVQKSNSAGEVTDTWVVTKEPLYKHLKSVIDLNSTESVKISKKDVAAIHKTVKNNGVVLAFKDHWSNLAYLINYSTFRGDTYLTFIDDLFIYKVLVIEGDIYTCYLVNKEKLKLTNISDLTNDSGFITNTTLESYYTKAETLELVNTKIQEVVGAAKLNEDSDAITAINEVLTGKATKEEVNSKVSKTGNETIDGNKTFSNDIKVGTNKVWHLGNDGPDSGLDADTLDGILGTDVITKDILPIPNISNNGNILQVVNGLYRLANLNLEDINSYGVEWDITVADPHLTRIGNMNLHRTLPILSLMKGCICLGNLIMYWLDENDWRYKKGGNPDKGETELLARLDGYDGTVRVYVPKFYIKSEEDGNKRRVRISSMLIDGTWTEQPACLVDAYRSTVLNTVPKNMGYLSTLPVNSAISVVNTATYCRGGGNNTAYDQYLAADPCRTGLGKPRTFGPNRATMRTYARKAGSDIMSYDQYKNIMYWLYVVEYANFNSQEAFNQNLTTEGYHQGGLGAGVTTWDWDQWGYYSGNMPITPCGYLNEYGNGTAIKSMSLITPTTSGGEPTITVTFDVPRWRGFDNPFGDIWTNLDGIIIDANNHPNNMNYVYTCQDPDKFGETLTSDYEKVGEEIHLNGYTKLFDLGDAAHIIPSVMGGNTTQYKCDYHWAGEKDAVLRTLFVGSSAGYGLNAGLGYFYSGDGVSSSWSNVGFRTVSQLVSSLTVL